jgi:hypothetical protein
MNKILHMVMFLSNSRAHMIILFIIKVKIPNLIK